MRINWAKYYLRILTVLKDNLVWFTIFWFILNRLPKIPNGNKTKFRTALYVIAHDQRISYKTERYSKVVDQINAVRAAVHSSVATKKHTRYFTIAVHMAAERQRHCIECTCALNHQPKSKHKLCSGALVDVEPE